MVIDNEKLIRRLKHSKRLVKDYLYYKLDTLTGENIHLKNIVYQWIRELDAIRRTSKDE